MRFPRLLYRLRQFIAAWRAAPGPADLEQVSKILAAPELALFQQLQPGEQAHSLAVLNNLRRAEVEVGHPDLCVAALLHDAGKLCYRLSPWERAWVVLGQAVLPRRVDRWGREGALATAPRWRRPFIVAVQHPAWGAALAEDAGASPLAVALIRRHQDFSTPSGDALETRLLRALQRADEDA